MNKEQLQTVLGKAGVHFGEEATNKELKALIVEHKIEVPPPAKVEPKIIKMVATTAMFENGKSLAAGDEFEASKERAFALSAVAKILD